MKFENIYLHIISEMNYKIIKEDIEQNYKLAAEDFVNEYNEIYNEKGMNAIVNSDGTIDVDGSIEPSVIGVNYLSKLIKHVGNNECVLAVKFNKVTGNFNCSNLRLINLAGCPSYVGGNFDCSYNKLTNLENCPQTINGNFNCSVQDNYNFSFVGGPVSVNGNFICHHYYQMNSTEGCPQNVKGECILDIQSGINTINDYPKYCKKLYITIGKNDDVRKSMFSDIKKLKRIVKYPIEINDMKKTDVPMQPDEYSNPYDSDNYAAGDSENY